MAATSNTKVLQVGYTHGKAGSCIAIIRTSQWLAEAGCDVTLLCSGGNLSTAKARDVNVVEAPWHNHSNRKLLRLAGRIRSVVRDFQPDIVHVHGRPESFACFLAKRKPDCYTMHESSVAPIAFFDRGPLRRFFKPISRRYFVLDDKIKDYMTSTFSLGDDRLEVMPHGVDCEHFHPPTQPERQRARSHFDLKDEIAVFYVGRLTGWKQPDAVVSLAAAARSKGLRKLRFIFVGDGSLREKLQEQIEGMQVSDICKLSGWMDPLLAYQAADLVVLPSQDQEGFPLVVAEALACGCPVLRSRVGGFNLQIKEGLNGFGCGISPQEFVAKGLEVLSHTEQLEPMRVSARQFALQHMSIEQFTQRTIAAYHDLCRTQALPAITLSRQ